MITPLKQVALLLAILVAAPSAASAERVLNRLSGTDLPGFDYRTLRNVPLAACERTCLADQQCGAFTYNERARWCFLKSAVGERVPYPGATSAVVETVDTRPALAMPDVSYLPAGYERDAERVLADVANAGPSGSAAGRVSPSQADTLSSNQTPAWLDLVRAMLADQANTYRARQDALRTAAGAAYLALRDARTAQEQGRALAALSLVLERQQVFRPAITASEASVALTGDPGEADRLARLRAQHGFRVLDYTVNADVVRPRLCVQFSEPLRGDGTGLQRFVTLDGEADPPLSVDGKQLCVEGLTHGERYVVVVREGLPATTGETLTTAATFRAYVRDRAPLARFDSNDYVLPRTAQGVPVTTINTDMLDLALYAINDRNLANVVRRGDLKRQLYPYELREIADERGAKVWTGTMAVASERNQSVRTLVPVESLMGTPRPGVYVLTARPVEQAGQSEALATQWFVVSDIGLSTFASAGGVDVFARSLGNSAPMGGVAISLLAANDDVLASALTDDEGYTRLQSRAAIGGGTRPQLVTAQHGEGDFAFVSLSSGAFELTDRGVKGRTAPGPVDAFVAAERGVYRAGETVHATVLVRDDQANALNVPVTMTLTRPDGVVARRLVVRAEAAGGAAVSLPLTTNAATGTWRLSATLDPDAPAVGETTFLVEDFVPQRIAVALSSPSVAATGGARMPVDLKADFLYGAPAAGLLLEGTVALTQTQTIEGFEGYRFGLDDDVATPSRTPLSSLPRTDALGEARLEVPIGTLTGATGPVDATIDVFAREPGGRQVAATLTRPVVDETPLIGIKPRFEGGRVGEGTVAGFDVIALSAERERQALDASWTLTRIERDFQWYRRNGRWFYDAIERTTKVNEGALSIDGAQAAVIETPVGWGRHRLEITANNGRIASSTTFDAGWVSSVSNAETPDVVEIHLDKEAYVAGETAQLRITPRQAGTALVTVLTDKVVFKASVDVPADGAELLIPVEQDWSPGAYVSATLFSHAAAGVGGPPYPSRAIGIAHMRVGTAAKTLNVAIETPEILTPRTTHDVPIRIDGLSPGESAHITVAAVDVGILNLTGYEAPDVDGHYLGQRRLGVDIRDLYGDLIDPNGAARGQPRSGGDGVGAGDALPPTQEPVSLFTGVLTVGADGRVNAPLAIPAFNGTLRVMVIAWSGTKVGDGAIDVTVRDPVVVVGTLPRFLAPGDATRMRFDLHNVAYQAGTFDLSVNAVGPVVVGALGDTIELMRDGRDTLEVPLTATAAGTAEIEATLTGPDGLSLTSHYTLTVRSAAPVVAERRLVAVMPGDTAILQAPVALGFSDTATLSVTVGQGDLDTEGLIAMLDRFPYGCAEQTVSRALPLLYVNDLEKLVGAREDVAVAERIEKAISRLLAYQSASGGFGLWNPGSDLWLTAYVMDFLSRAREAGYGVPQSAFEAGLDRLQSLLSFLGDLSGERSTEIAYASYVLARNGRAAIGDLRYLAEEKIDDFASPLARAQLAASLAFTGDQALADRLFGEAVVGASFDERPNRGDYGTPLRDAAAMVTLASESRAPARIMDQLTGLLDRERTGIGERAYSTQEAAWLVLSAREDLEAPIDAVVAGTRTIRPGSRTFATVEPAGVTVENLGDAPLSVAATVTGTPLSPLAPVASGLSITRTYHGLDGSNVALDNVAQNARLIVRLTFEKTVESAMRVMLTDLLPAGFEVENPRLMGGRVPGVPMVRQGAAPEYIEFRDDRFAAAWNLPRGNVNQPITVSYVVRAVSPGTFALPAAEVSDMYQPQYVARTDAGALAIRPVR